MNKSMVMGLAIGGGALMLVMWKKKSSGPRTPLGIPAPHNLMGANARVDNQSQPWYTGPMAAITQKAQAYAQNPQLAQSDSQKVIQATKDVWGTVSGWFGATGSTADHVDAAVPTPGQVGADQSTGGGDPSLDNLPAAGIDQSNMIGNQYSDYLNQSIGDPNIMASNDSNSGAFIDSSNADGNIGSFGSDNSMSA